MKLQQLCSLSSLSSALAARGHDDGVVRVMEFSGRRRMMLVFTIEK